MIKKIKMLVIWGLILFSRLGFAGEKQAIETPSDLGEVVVTGTKTERKITEVPAAIDVISAEEIKQSKAWNVGEVLETLPGVQAQSLNGAYDTHIIIRGAGAKAAYGVRDIMIMLDGIPITDPDSLTRLDVVDTSLIERIEVLKGPNSTLYGANAAGGVINIITKSPLAYQGLSLKSSVGSFNSQGFHLSYGGQQGERLFYFLTGSRRSTDSWREHNEFETNQLSARVDYLIDDTSSLDFLASYSEADLELPLSLTEDEFEDDPSQVASDWPNCGRYSKAERFSLGYEKEFSKGHELSAKLYFQNWEHYHPVPRQINDGGAKVYGAEFQLNIPHRLWGTKNILTVGLSGQRDERDTQQYTYEDWNPEPPYSSSDDAGELMSEDDSSVYKWGIYLQESLRPLESLLVDLGLRYDEVRFMLDEEQYLEWGYIFRRPPQVSSFGYIQAIDTIEEEKTWQRISPRLGLNYNLNKTTSLYGTVGTGFQTPTQGELGTNNKLKPQEAINYEVGLKGRFSGGHKLDLVLFYTTLEDEIIRLMDEDGVSFYDNAGETLHKGIELSGLVQILPGLSFGAAYAYSDFTFEEFAEMEKVGADIISRSRDGNRIPLVPEHQYNFWLYYKHASGLSAKIDTNTWEKYYVDAANSQTYKGYTTVNARLGYEWKQISMSFRVDNVFDQKYAAEVSSSYGTTRFTPAAPQTWMLDVGYQF